MPPDAQCGLFVAQTDVDIVVVVVVIIVAFIVAIAAQLHVAACGQ
jgi:hypothetical protein